MLKYVLTTEKCIVNLIDNTTVKMSHDVSNAIRYNTIGEAMIDCVQVNKILGYPCCKVVSVNM